MNMNDERRYTEDEEAEREQARAEYEGMTDEELYYALETIRYEDEQKAKNDYEAERMEILEERGW